jgi:hypothetical protein
MSVADMYNESKNHKTEVDFRKLNKNKGKRNTKDTKALALF